MTSPIPSREKIEGLVAELRMLALDARTMVAEGNCTLDLVSEMEANATTVERAANALTATLNRGEGGEPVAWIVRLKYSDRWSGEMLTDVLPTNDGTYQIVRPLYAHPASEGPPEPGAGKLREPTPAPNFDAMSPAAAALAASPEPREGVATDEVRRLRAVVEALAAGEEPSILFARAALTPVQEGK